MIKTYEPVRTSRLPTATRRIRHLGWIFGTLLMVGVVPLQSYATSTSPTTGIALRYKRQDLASPAAAHALLQRIGAAALESCGASSFSLSEYKRATLQSQCWRDAVAGAVRRIDSPVLSAEDGRLKR